MKLFIPFAALVLLIAGSVSAVAGPDGEINVTVRQISSFTVDKHAHTALVAGKGSVYVENKGTFGGGTNDLPISISFADASGRAFAKCRDMLGGELDSRHEIYVNGTGSYQDFPDGSPPDKFSATLKTIELCDMHLLPQLDMPGQNMPDVWGLDAVYNGTALTGPSYLFLEKQFANQMKEESFIQTPPPDLAARLDEIVGAKERSDEQKVADIRALINATLSAEDRKYLNAFPNAHRLLRQLSDNDEAKLHFVINDKSFSDTERHRHVKELLQSAAARVDVGPLAAPAKKVNALLSLIPLILAGGLGYAMFGLRSRTGRIVARVAAGAVVLVLLLSGGLYIRSISGFTPDIDANGAPRHFSKTLPEGLELADFSILGDGAKFKTDFLNYQASHGPYALMLRIPLDKGQAIQVSSVTITYADGQEAHFSGTELKPENVPYGYLRIPDVVTKHQDLVAKVEGTIGPVDGSSRHFSVSYGFRAEGSFVALPTLLTGIGG